jgi:protein involved in polysaccharide export with SLBB domain
MTAGTFLTRVRGQAFLRFLQQRERDPLMIKQYIFVFSLCLWCPPLQRLQAADTNGATAVNTVTSMELLDDKQKVGPGDVLTYRVLEDQDEPRSLTVTDSGELDVPYLGLVHSAGKTSLQLAKEIKALLEKKLYYQANVIIAVRLVNKTRVTGKVYVTGQVRNTGGFEIPAGETLTVSKAILNAGGFSDFSDKKNVRLIRKVGNARQTTIVNVQDVWNKSKPEADLVVLPDDLIVVPARLVNY